MDFNFLFITRFLLCYCLILRFLIIRNPRSINTNSNSRSFTYTIIPVYQTNKLIINVIMLYAAETNPIENITIPMIKLRSVFFRNFYSLRNYCCFWFLDLIMSLNINMRINYLKFIYVIWSHQKSRISRESFYLKLEIII